MGQITSSVGLISGLDIAGIVDQLISIESRPRIQVEQQNAILQSTQAAYQSINARLLALDSSANALTQPLNFRSTTASSSNESVLSVSSSSGAIPGSYSFRVRQLVAAQQTLSKGFADDSATGVGIATTLTFDRGAARLSESSILDDLNAGEGVQRGFIRITDRSGTSELVDLSDAVTIDDVVNTINSSLNINVRASLDGDQLQIIDQTGLTTTDLRVQDVGLTTTATSLGLAGTGTDDTLTGTAINTVGVNTLLSELNDGNGVRTESGLDDLSITSGGTTYDISLSSAETLEDVIDTINTATAGNVTAAISTDGVSLTLTDNNGGGAGFAVAALNGSNAASDLGILGDDSDGSGAIEGDRFVAALNSRLLRFLNGGDGLAAFGGSTQPPVETTTNLADLFQGTGVAGDFEILAKDDAAAVFTVDTDALTTVQDLIDAIDTATGGKVTATLTDDRLVLIDSTSGEENLVIRDAAGSTAATDLGIVVNTTGDRTSSAFLDPSGALDTGAVISFTNSLGSTNTVDLSSAESVSDLIDLINNADIGVEASLNNAGNGLVIEDTAGGAGDLVIADDTGSALATQLGLTGTFADRVADTGSLNFQYVTQASSLDTLGVTRGEFLITDSNGDTATVDLTQGNEQTIQDVLDEINSRGLALTARLNDAGNGITLEDTGSGALAITVEENGASTAADLGLLGSAENAGDDLNGSFAVSIDISSADTLQDIAQKINDSNADIAAAIINDGSSGTPFRLSLTARNAGTDGAFVFDDGGLGLDSFNLADARDAVVFLGSGNSTGETLTVFSQSNTLEGIVPGATVTLLSTSDQPVQANISDDPASVRATISTFVENFNGLIDTIDEFDTFNTETQERGLLLGDPAVNSVRQQLFNTVIRQNTELSQTLNSLSQVGITVGSGARLQFDESRFDTAFNEDRDAVVDLFTLRETDDTQDTDGDGENDEVVTARGIGFVLNDLLERLTDPEFGPIEAAIDRLETQVENNNSRIEFLNERLEDERSRLELEFINMERALADLQSQGQALAAFQPVQFSSGGGGGSAFGI